MKLFGTVLISLLIRELLEARTVNFKSFTYWPKESDLIDFGTLKLTKIRNKNIFVLNGNYAISKNFGNEKLLTFILMRNGGQLARQTYAFCEYMNVDKTIWPELVKASNFPKNNPCPFPEVNEIFNFFRCF